MKMKPLAPLTDFLSRQSSVVTLTRQRCLRTRLSSNQCRNCIESCPSGALSINKRKVVVDGSQCTACMLCVAACPQDALDAGFDFGRFLDSFATKSKTVISCIQQPQSHPDEIIVPCVGIISKQLLTAIVLGPSASVTVNLTGCSDCPNQNGAAVFKKDCQQITEFFSDSDPTKIILAQDEVASTTNHADRRSFLTKVNEVAFNVSKKCFSSPLPPQEEKDKTSRRIPFKTELIKSLMVSVNGELSLKILTLFGHRLSVNRECTCCPLCKGICPTGALRIERHHQGKKLKFTTLDCNGCGLCIEFCKKTALSFKQQQ